MKRSGNGTIAKQYLYVFWNLPYFWVVKVGIGGNVKRRLRQVDKENKGVDFLVFALRIPFAYQVEQFVHSAFSFLRINWSKGTGRTERFLFPVAVPAIILAVLVFFLEYAFYIILALVVSWFLAGRPDF